MNRRGMTLLEVVVALAILGLVVTAYLELFGGALASARVAQTWSQAVTYATEMMEQRKLEANPAALATGVEALPGGFARRVEITPWASPNGDGGFAELRVVVSLPGGGEYTLARLVRVP